MMRVRRSAPVSARRNRAPSPSTSGAATGSVVADVVAVVSAKSPVVALSSGQVVDIFLGKTSRFPDGSQAVPVDQVEGSAARDEFYTRFAGKADRSSREELELPVRDR